MFRLITNKVNKTKLASHTEQKQNKITKQNEEWLSPVVVVTSCHQWG